jgi:hypothetical protein
MRHYTPTFTRRTDRPRKRIADWLIYLPGALILMYGLWLSLTAA